MQKQHFSLLNLIEALTKITLDYLGLRLSTSVCLDEISTAIQHSFIKKSKVFVNLEFYFSVENWPMWMKRIQVSSTLSLLTKRYCPARPLTSKIRKPQVWSPGVAGGANLKETATSLTEKINKIKTEKVLRTPGQLGLKPGGGWRCKFE